MAGLVIAFVSSGCVPNVKLLSASIEQVPRESLPNELTGPWPQESALLRVELQASRNLRAIADDHELNVGVEAYMCDHRRHRLSAMPYLFDEFGRIDAYHGAGSESKAIWFFLAQTSRPRRPDDDGPDVPAYDLRSATGEICIKLGGGNMIGQTIRSNVLRTSPAAGTGSLPFTR